jgi:hypothetical protein
MVKLLRDLDTHGRARGLWVPSILSLGAFCATLGGT